LLRARLQRAILERDQLQQAMITACNADPHSTECLSLTQKYNSAGLQVEFLRQRLIACRP
jgi:hypothetical protein